jgi:pimeloyl-ACP methyl ester carboxylesterase
VRIRTGPEYVNADLVMPYVASGLVLFAHGSGSSRHSPRNRVVAEALQRAGFATLLADLLTREEEARDEFTGEFRFNIELLGRRVVDVTDWILSEPVTRALPVGYFGASTGAAAALVAAARRPEVVRAVVSRGGRPDLAGAALPNVKAPTLLIVGGRDVEVISLNRLALRQLPDTSSLQIVPGATHLFPEPGALEAVIRLASKWFRTHLTRQAAAWQPSDGW